MARFLIDTNILIDHLRGHSTARTLVDEHIQQQDELMVSVITRIEIMAGMRAEEETDVQHLLSQTASLYLDDAVAYWTGSYLRKFQKSHDLELGDAVIAATAKIAHATLLTRNLKHFPMKDIQVRKPY